MLRMMDGRASPLYRHPGREAVEDYAVNRAYWISRIGLYRVHRVLPGIPYTATLRNNEFYVFAVFTRRPG